MIRHRLYLNSVEGFCCALASLFPKVFCTGVLTWSALAFLSESCYQNIAKTSSILAGLVAIICISLYLLCIFTYYKVIYVGPGSPSDFLDLHIRNIASLKDTIHIPEEDVLTSLLQEERDMPPAYLKMHTLKPNAPFRYCLKCQVWKPDRSHHCSRCKKCILRMDHHCPWFAACIGYHNQKFFIQFLMYVSAYCLYIFIVTTVLLYKFFSDQDYYDGYLSLNLIFLFILSVTFFLAVTGFTLFSVWLVLKNTTTIEFQDHRWSHDQFQYRFDSQGKREKLGHLFDLGWKRNWEDTMGPTWFHWLLPVLVTSMSAEAEYRNGLNFEIDHEILDQYMYNAQLQDQLNQQLADYKNRVRMEREQ